MNQVFKQFPKCFDKFSSIDARNWARARVCWLASKSKKKDVPGLLAVLRPSNLFQSLGIESKNETLALVGVKCHV